MSYDLYVEGDLDYVDLAVLAQDITCANLFPIEGDGGPDALGIALLSGRTSEEGAPVRALLQRLQLLAVSIHDLYTGTTIATDDDIEALFARVFDVEPTS